jgi:hypothetical protein
VKFSYNLLNTIWSSLLFIWPFVMMKRSGEVMSESSEKLAKVRGYMEAYGKS